MPPVMGAAAFLMAEFLQVPYAERGVAAAILPALLYYFGAVHSGRPRGRARAASAASTRRRIPRAGSVLRRRLALSAAVRGADRRAVLAQLRAGDGGAAGAAVLIVTRLAVRLRRQAADTVAMPTSIAARHRHRRARSLHDRARRPARHRRAQHYRARLLADARAGPCRQRQL